MINGAHSHSAIRGSFSINVDNGDSSQNVTFKIRVRNCFFRSRNKDFFQTFFQNNYSFLFETQGYQNWWSIMTLKKQEQKLILFSWFKLMHKNKNKFLFISIYHTFSKLLKIAGQNSRDFFKNWRLCANPENEFAFFQTSVHLFPFDEMSNIGEFP